MKTVKSQPKRKSQPEQQSKFNDSEYTGREMTIHWPHAAASMSIIIVVRKDSSQKESEGIALAFMRALITQPNYGLATTETPRDE